MYRVMVVDDEPLILAGIISMLCWEEHGCKIVGKASNGLQALEKLEELRPDIVITDIKMPAMDGISFMKKAREQGELAAFILLTNMEEFSFVKEAISLNVVEYLIKLELTEETLLESVHKAIKRCEIQKKLEKTEHELSYLPTPDEVMGSYFQRILLDETDLDLEEQQLANISEYFKEPVVIMINFNYKLEGALTTVTWEDQRKTMSFARDIISDMVKGFFEHSCLIRREQNSFILVISAYSVENYEESIQRMGEKIISVVKDYFEAGVAISVSQKGKSLMEFTDLIYQVMSGMNYYYYNSMKTIVFYSEKCEHNQNHSSNFSIGFLKKELSQMILHNEVDSFRETMIQITTLLEEHKPSKSQAINVCSNLYYFITSFFEDNRNLDFPYAVNLIGELNDLGNLKDIIGWISCFCEEVIQILKIKKDTKPDKLMTQVQNYVSEHYREKITLGQAADALRISQGYLSSTFKKQSGKSFSEYVTELKIEKAKDLIKTQDYMMYEISDLLGFDTPYYFSTVFKRVTGYSPKEYEATI